MGGKQQKRAKPTAADVRAAQALKREWLALPKNRRPTQDQMAEAWGEGGSQSLMSQYLNGRIPLNLRAVTFFSRQLNVDPKKIYPDLPGLDTILWRNGEPEPSDAAHLSARDAGFAKKVGRLPERARRLIEAQVDLLLDMAKSDRGRDNPSEMLRIISDPLVQSNFVAADPSKRSRRKRGKG